VTRSGRSATSRAVASGSMPRRRSTSQVSRKWAEWSTRSSAVSPTSLALLPAGRCSCGQRPRSGGSFSVTGSSWRRLLPSSSCCERHAP
jgi:hypothetical protein